MRIDLKVALSALAVAAFLALAPNSALAQANSCTSISPGQTIDINVWSDCKRVYFGGYGGTGAVCAPTNTTAAEWQSFYNNPPAGVTIAACASSCAGYFYATTGGCYYNAYNSTQSCDTTCASHGGCNAAHTKDIGSDDPGSTRCSAVVLAITGNSGTPTGYNSGSDGCFITPLKAGWIMGNYYGAMTTCASAAIGGRVCACNN